MAEKKNCGGSIMKFPRRGFMHLAVGAAARCRPCPALRGHKPIRHDR
jgi:hypothetical protein